MHAAVFLEKHWYTRTCFSTELHFTQEDPIYQAGLCWECEVDAKVSVISNAALICCDHQWDISKSAIILTQILVANNGMRQGDIWIKRIGITPEKLSRRQSNSTWWDVVEEQIHLSHFSLYWNDKRNADLSVPCKDFTGIEVCTPSVTVSQ